MSVKIVDSAWTVAETTALQALEIKPGAGISAPEGKSVTLSVDGVGQDIKPGKYEGDIVLTVTEAMPVDFMGLGHVFRAALTIVDGKYAPQKSVPAVIQSGDIAEGIATGVKIRDNQEAFNGIYVVGDGEYLLKDVVIEADGNGGNDFCGFGALLMSGEKAKLTVENADITARGAARNTVFGGGDSILTVNNSKIAAFNGTLPDDYVDNIMPGQMKAVPWMLGLRGNCRATNLADNGIAYYNNCELRSEGWGVMSTDGVVVSRLFINDSLVEITGDSGYGAFSIGDCIDTFDNCTFNVPDYALIMANDTASGEFKGGTVVNSKRFGVMCFRNKGGKLTVKDGTVFNTEKASFLVKGCAPTIECDSAELNTKSGVIIQFYNTDDPGNPQGYYSDPVGDDKLNPDHDKTTAAEAVDLIAKFSNMTLNGSFYNGMTDIEGDTGPKMEMGGGPGGPGGAPGGPGGAPGGPGGGPGGPGGAPGGPGGAPGGPGGPGGAPGGPGGAPGAAASGAKNMQLTFENCVVNGMITACKTMHRVAKISKENNDQLGEVDNTPQPAVNNGVIASLDGKTTWNVTGTSYLTALTIEPGAKLAPPNGKSLRLTVDGAEKAVAPGTYTGNITVEVI